MKTVFERGKTNEIWKNIELEKWFDPAFRDSLIIISYVQLENNMEILF